MDGFARARRLDGHLAEERLVFPHDLVEDQGPGIPETKKENLFQTFHLGSGLHRDHGGLGLAISKGILDSHHGHIWAEDAQPTGARLMFFLPVIPEEQTPSHTPNR